MGERLAGKVGIVTGGASGIGEAVARRFAAEGASVIIADVNRDDGEKLQAELGDSTLFVAVDVSDAAQWETAVSAAVDKFGRLDILVNNAGIGGLTPIVGFDPEQHRRVIDVNLNGIIFGMAAAQKALAASGRGSIVNISSIDGLGGVRGMSSYVASKFAARGMSKSAAQELGRYGIRVNSVHPGMIATPAIRRHMENSDSPLGGGTIENLMSMQPIARLGEPEEVANLVLFLASDEASYCTGSEYVVDGGHMAGPWRPPLPDHE